MSVSDDENLLSRHQSGEYERVGNMSLRLHGRDGTVLISLVHRYLPIVRLQVADGRTYFSTRMRSYHLCMGNARPVDISWDRLNHNRVTVTSELTELIYHMDAGRGWPEIKLWFEFMPSNEDIGVRLFIDAPSLMRRARGEGDVLEMGITFYMDQA